MFVYMAKKATKKASPPLLEYPLLQAMCAIHAPSGNEANMTTFLLNYIKSNMSKWKVKPKVFHGEGFQHNLVLVFGKPRTAIFAHIDSIGFTVRYRDELVKIGGPAPADKIKLQGSDSKGARQVTLRHIYNSHKQLIGYKQEGDLFETGTDLTYVPDWREDKEFVQCCYMDNRLGVYNALKVAETLQHGAIVFSTWEEHGGGSVAYLQKFLAKKYKITQALISDISWITNGVKPGLGPVISLRDSLIPRKVFVNRIREIATKNNCRFQLEVEGSGGSDAKELQMAAYPWDWCFIGAAEQFVHSPDEKVHKKDIEGMIALYKTLMAHL